MENATVLYITIFVVYAINAYQIQKLQMKINNMMGELRSLGKDFYNDKDYEPDYDKIK